ncbi:MAG: TetR/AcrR family transcriptional regulator [Deltaproteobacteria bacterium]|nr:TetR/AcrR family transcriptional regulator [Deltaproteobacteria bacterium]
MNSKVPVEPRKREKYMAIIDAALEVFAEYGYHNCQVAKIARQAGIADGTIYLYFANKEDVLVSVFREKMSEYIRQLKVLLQNYDTAVDKLSALVHYHFNYLEKNHSLANFLQIQLRQSDTYIRAGISVLLKQYYQLIETLVEEGKQQGSINPRINTKVAREVIFGSMDEIVSCWVFSSRKYSLSKNADDVLVILKNGLAVPKP